MSIKGYIVCASVIANLVLGYWVCEITYNSDTSNLRKLERSKGREEILIQQDSIKAIELNKIRLENHVKDSLLLLKPKEIIIIKNNYYEKADVVMSLSYDSSLVYLSERLKGVTID